MKRTFNSKRFVVTYLSRWILNNEAIIPDSHLKLKGHNVFDRLISTLKIFGHVCKSSLQYSSRNERFKSLVFVNSKNQLAALPESCRKDAVSFDRRLTKNIIRKTGLIWWFLVDLFSLYLSLFSYLRKKRRLDLWFIALLPLGYYSFWYNYLKYTNSSTVIVANDVSPIELSLVFAALRLEKKVIYYQHGLVPQRYIMPPFDTSFLYGEYSKSRYLKTYGSVRFRYKIEQLELLKPENLCVLGICLNPSDKSDKFIPIINNLRNNSYKVLVRFHPEMKHVELPVGCKIHTGDLVDFASKCTVVIASNSTVHLDLNYLGVKTIWCDLQEP